MKLLAIVSGDYGELSYARYFLDNLGINPMPIMLVSAVLRQPEGIEAGIDVRTYGELADIVRVVEETKPAMVLLFSGYLLAIGNHFSLFKAMLLFRLLRRRGVRIITSDPFIGLVRSPWSLRFEAVLRLRKKSGHDIIASIVAPLLSIRTYIIYLQLRHEWHIYPAPVVHRFLAPDHRGCSFFNPLTDSSATTAAVKTNVAPVWLFVLSQVDFHCQTKRYGEGFAGHVAVRLHDAAHRGRRVVMIGPMDLIEDLSRRIDPGLTIELYARCPHHDYMQILLQAEYLFLWNFYSFSVLHRVLANRPILFFDEGHMVSVLPALKQEGIDTFYAGWRPPLLRVDEPLNMPQLEQLAQETCSNFLHMKARIAQGLSPKALLDMVGTSDRQ